MNVSCFICYYNTRQGTCVYRQEAKVITEYLLALLPNHHFYLPFVGVIALPNPHFFSFPRPATELRQGRFHMMR